jgi:hypothetical protein
VLRRLTSFRVFLGPLASRNLAKSLESRYRWSPCQGGRRGFKSLLPLHLTKPEDGLCRPLSAAAPPRMCLVCQHVPEKVPG